MHNYFLCHKKLQAKTPEMLNFWGFVYVREKIRTPDTLVRSQVLYPAELHTHKRLLKLVYRNKL